MPRGTAESSTMRPVTTSFQRAGYPAPTVLQLLLACTSPPPPPAAPAPRSNAGLTAPASPVWRALDHLDAATLTFPPTNAPADTDADGTFPLPDGWKADGRNIGRLKAWGRTLPFQCDMPRPNYAPWGARLYRGVNEIPYMTNLDDLQGGGWFVEKGQIFLLAIESPSTWSTPPELRVPEIAAELRHRNFQDSGLSPAEFARAEATLAGTTRPALHVPAPGEARFALTVPAGARLELGVGILPDPLRGSDAGDGAEAAVYFETTELWSGDLDPGDPFEDIVLDLSALAGRTGELRFTTSPGRDNTFDHVVFSAPTLRSPLGREPRHLVVVGIDTLRADALGVHGSTLGATPELDTWAQEAVVFESAHAPAPRTRPSFRTALTGRYPIEAVAAPTIAEILAPAGFRTAGIAANVHLVPRFGFNAGFEEWQYANGARADVQVERALTWQQAHADEDTFLFVHIMDPHTHYNAPSPYGERFLAGKSSRRVPPLFDRWQIVLMTQRGTLNDEDRAVIRGRYDGEVAYTSSVLGPFLHALDDIAGRTATVILTDHGEEFWDHGGFEHNHSLYDELVRSLLWIRPPGGQPGGPHRESAPVGLVDVVPTLLDLVGVAATTPMDGTSLRSFVDLAAGPTDPVVAALAARPQPIGHLMFDTERWGVVFERWKYILTTATGVEEAYDLAADPGERTNLVESAAPDRLLRLRTALGTATGWPMAPGWRIRLPKDRPVTLDFAFAAPVLEVGVIDPEAALIMRANLEWGEHPRLLPGEVGTFLTSPDRTGARFIARRGTEGQTIYIACDGPCPSATISVAGTTPTSLVDGRLEVPAGRFEVRSGWLLLQRTSEADALKARPTDTTQLEALRSLGYLHDD